MHATNLRRLLLIANDVINQGNIQKKYDGYNDNSSVHNHVFC